MKNDKMYRDQYFTIQKQQEEIYILKQKIDMLIYIIALQNHYLNVPIKLPDEFDLTMTELPF